MPVDRRLSLLAIAARMPHICRMEHNMVSRQGENDSKPVSVRRRGGMGRALTHQVLVLSVARRVSWRVRRSTSMRRRLFHYRRQRCPSCRASRKYMTRKLASRPLQPVQREGRLHSLAMHDRSLITRTFNPRARVRNIRDGVRPYFTIP